MAGPKDRRFSNDELRALSEERLELLLARILPTGHLSRDKARWIAPLTGVGSNCVLVVELRGPKRGLWFDTSRNKGGRGTIDLLAHTLSIPWRDAAWALDKMLQ